MMSSRKLFPLLFSFLIGVATCSSPLFAEDPVFIGDIERDKDAWLGKQVTVEGRITFVDRIHFKFRNSAILFESSREIRKFITKPENLEATGRLRKDGNAYKFEATSVEAAKSDSEQIGRKRSALERESPQQHYDLAAWALKRGEFYQDVLLKQSAGELNLLAYRIEMNQLTSDDADGRIALSAKGADLGIAAATRENLIHEAYRIRIRSGLKDRQPDWDSIAAGIVKDCPGAEAPLSDAPEFLKIREEYLLQPDAVYKTADAPTRILLHRVLWGEVKRLSILGQVSRNPSRGAELAAQFRKTLPEYAADAETLLDDLLMKRGSEVERLTRREMIELKEDYLARNKPQDAERIVEEWFAFRRRRLKDDDLDGLLQLASDYEALSRDPQPIISALIDAAVAYPQSKEIVGTLERLGYKLVEGKWLSAAEQELMNNSVHQKELREGLVTVGMSASEVRKSQGLPSSMTRIATKGELREIWSYGQTGTRGGFAIYFRKGQLDAEAKVIAINDIRTK